MSNRFSATSEKNAARQVNELKSIHPLHDFDCLRRSAGITCRAPGYHPGTVGGRRFRYRALCDQYVWFHGDLPLVRTNARLDHVDCPWGVRLDRHLGLPMAEYQ